MRDRDDDLVRTRSQLELAHNDAHAKDTAIFALNSAVEITSRELASAREECRAAEQRLQDVQRAAQEAVRPSRCGVVGVHPARWFGSHAVLLALRRHRWRARGRTETGVSLHVTRSCARCASASASRCRRFSRSRSG